MNSSGQFVVKVPIEARAGQVVYDRTGFGDIFSYIVPANATPDELTTVWPIGVDQASYSGRCAEKIVWNLGFGRLHD